MNSWGHDEVRSLLPQLASHPQELVSLSQERWDIVIRQARSAGILARFCHQLDELDALEQVPVRPRHHLEAARTLALKHVRDVRWEVTCIRQVLAETDTPIILLKGAAYVMAELPPARGRLFGDIDFMVRRERIGEVEEVLLSTEWFSATKDLYDQRYYRRWTHQIPPLQHHKRNTVLDVHHTIVPVTARSPVNAQTLSAASVALDEDPNLRILAPTDMVLHSAVHLFNEGEFDRGLRDLLDLDDLLCHFGALPGFWEELPQRAETLGLVGPLYNTLRYREHFLGRSVPEQLRAAYHAWAPASPKGAFFDALFHRALLPDHATCDTALTGAARWTLYVRSHYLRMPFHLLLPHLLRKAFHKPAEA